MDFHHIMMLIHHKLCDSYKLYYCQSSAKIPGGLVMRKQHHSGQERWAKRQNQNFLTGHGMMALISIYRFIYWYISTYIIWTLDVHLDAEYIGAKLYIGGGTSMYRFRYSGQSHSLHGRPVWHNCVHLTHGSGNPHFDIVLFLLPHTKCILVH